MLLVTGGAGFIGSNVVADLNEAGHTDVVVNDKDRSDFVAVNKNLIESIAQI